MSLCERVMELSDGLADLLIEADGCAATDEAKSLGLLKRAVDQAHAVKFGNGSARAILATARPAPVAVAQHDHDRFQPANDHGALPEQPDPLIA